MAIDEVWQDENGKELALCPVPWEDRMSRSAYFDRSHCLQYVDPYADATFNPFQLPQLIREMEQAVSQLQPSKLRSQAEQVLGFVRGCVGLHTYVKFMGD